MVQTTKYLYKKSTEQVSGPLSTQRVCPPPAPKAVGTHSPGGEGVGVNISEDARHWIGLVQYNPCRVQTLLLYTVGVVTTVFNYFNYCWLAVTSNVHIQLALVDII